jgi:hypothetical protein
MARACSAEGGLRDHEAVARQTFGDGLSDERFIVDDEHIHPRHPPARWWFRRFRQGFGDMTKC